MNSKFEDYHIVQVPLASFLKNMQHAIKDVNISFGLIGGKNPFELHDQRAYDMFALTYMTFSNKQTTDDGFDIIIKYSYAFSEGLERYFDQHFFASIQAFLPNDGKIWQLQQISLTNIDPKLDHNNHQNKHLLPLLSGQLLTFKQALETLIDNDPDEQFCLLYKEMKTEENHEK